MDLVSPPKCDSIDSCSGLRMHWPEVVLVALRARQHWRQVKGNSYLLDHEEKMDNKLPSYGPKFL